MIYYVWRFRRTWIKQINQKSGMFSLLVFLDKDYKIETYVCNGCNDLLIMSINLNDNAILKNKLCWLQLQY